jgi:hypothetical protein
LARGSIAGSSGAETCRRETRAGPAPAAGGSSTGVRARHSGLVVRLAPAYVPVLHQRPAHQKLRLPSVRTDAALGSCVCSSSGRGKRRSQPGGTRRGKLLRRRLRVRTRPALLTPLICHFGRCAPARALRSAPRRGGSVWIGLPMASECGTGECQLALVLMSRAIIDRSVQMLVPRSFSFGLTRNSAQCIATGASAGYA